MYIGVRRLERRTKLAKQIRVFLPQWGEQWIVKATSISLFGWGLVGMHHPLKAVSNGCEIDVGVEKKIFHRQEEVQFNFMGLRRS